MTNHPARPVPQRPFPSLPAQAAALVALRRQAGGITQATAAELCRAGLTTWRQWEYGDRAMPAAVMELLCLALMVGTLERGPYIAPGEWAQPWVRYELMLWFTRQSS